MLLVDPFSEILRTPTVGVLVLDMLLLLVLVSIAFFIGITVGWSWKPTWVSNFAIKHQTVGTNNVDLGSSSVDRKMDKQPFKLQPSMENPSCSSSVVKKENNLLTDGDLKHLWHLVEKRDGGPPWKHMMDRSTATMTYQAWQRDPETGPPQYCSRTVYEDATPELLRDFFWDDDLRLKWDDMLLHATTLEEFRDVGASVVHWIRRFPFFCSDREYTIGRRMWDLEGSFYCVTKGVSCPLVPRKQKPRRVDVYHSSWFIRSVGSKKGNNQPASEVVFFHHEDMGIPWEIAKFAVSQGMWGTARKVERGFRWYQNERICSKTTSPHIAMAEMSTKIDQNYLARLESDEDHDVAETEMVVQQEKQGGINLPKLLVIGGAVILACSLDRGLLTKGVIFRVARRFGNVGRRFPPTQL
ncbi:uncharacterized protein LOC112510359 [Cynara cardunculus var. scolymus]|uniref:uncharacterized protein LOC112510359 n=1 Tax=Cynara cardunculus var. scolymus TaxID=59895 RepID=UPI000D62A592|nr:uncharacterized protein LOC112510359 [Cynara cardunculus var. scolymus]